MCGVAGADATVEVGVMLSVCVLEDEQAAMANTRSIQSSFAYPCTGLQLTLST